MNALKYASFAAVAAAAWMLRTHGEAAYAILTVTALIILFGYTTFLEAEIS